MEKHVTIAAILKIGLGILGILIAVIAFVAVVGGGIISRDQEAIFITSLVGSIIALVLVLLSVPGIVGGIGLLRRWPWARILVLILAVFDLVNIPFGTFVGAYTIWVLMQDETIELFSSKCC